MEFKDKKSIYIQIADYICENILNGKWTQGDRIPSVRDLAIEMEVNPNTVMRSYALLQDQDLIFNKRGIGYFVAEDAIVRVEEIKKEDFIINELPDFFKTIDMLKIEFKSLEKMYQSYKKTGYLKKLKHSG